MADKTVDMSIEPELQEPFDQALAAVQKELSPGDFQSAWEAGRSMDIAHTVQFALEQ